MRNLLTSAFGAVAKPLAAAAQSVAASPSPDDAGRKRFFDAALKNDTVTLQKFVMEYPEAAVDWKSDEGMTALMYACREGCKDAAWLLIRSDPFIDDENDNGSTPLMFAAFAGKATIVEELLKKGADINHINKNGVSALMMAASDGLKNTVVLLLGKGAAADLRDKDGKSALDYATDGDFRDVAALIGQAIKDQSVAAAAKREKEYEEGYARGEHVFPPLKAPVMPAPDADTVAFKNLEQRMKSAGLT